MLSILIYLAIFSTRKTANKSNKYIVNKCFKPLEKFPFGKLPTLKQVLERC